MFFKRKSKKNEATCPECRSNLNRKYSYCPFCGIPLIDPEEELREFGMLGKNKEFNEDSFESMLAQGNLGMLDKIMNTLVQQLMKGVDSQFRELEKGEKTEVRTFPNGVRISIGPSMREKRTKNSQLKLVNKEISEKQIEKMSRLPRTEAKTKVRRLSDKIIYELDASGIESKNDVFVSRLESGYEIKAIGKNKIYVNNFPVNLPLKNVSLKDNGLIIEFGLNQ